MAAPASSEKNFKSKIFKFSLKNNLHPDDNVWSFKIPTIKNLGEKIEDKNGTRIRIMAISVSQEEIVLSTSEQEINRVISTIKPELILRISFSNFRFPEKPSKITSEYIERMLKGITLNGRKFMFFGHSNSQLKSRTCYMICAQTGTFIMDRINKLGDFTKLSSVAKRAKRIGLMFSAAEASIYLPECHTQDIEDIEEHGYIYTDGCGNISKQFSETLAKTRKIIFHNTRYVPSCFQIRYKGYKGMLMVSTELGSKHKNNKLSDGKVKDMPVKVQFRKSMKKFSGCQDDSFSILDYAKPFTYAFLNGELVTLLSTLGIEDQVFLKKQEEYFQFLENAKVDPKTAFDYLCYKSEHTLAEQVLLDGISKSIKTKIHKFAREEWNGTFKKNENRVDNERVRIMIPKSRLLFGVCDNTGTLKEGQCHVRITVEGSGPKSIDGAYVIVSRNPCLHPGDIRKFKPVQIDELNHLVDCIVFPTVGKRDAASLMSGGDLDGDKFFVSWDSDIIPTKLFEPFGYPAAKEDYKEITYEKMIQYFANYNNASLGRVKNLYLDWIRTNPQEGAGSKECQQLNALFSSCVDGERIKIPEVLECPPKLAPEQTFILDVLCENVKRKAEIIFKTEPEDVVFTQEGVVEYLVSCEDMCLKAIRNEFEVFKLILHYCQKNGSAPVEEFFPYLNFGNFTNQQKHAVLAHLEDYNLREELYTCIFNGLNQSEIIPRAALRSFNLDNPKVRWQLMYTTFMDDGFRLEVMLEKFMINFDKKLLVCNVDESLKVAIYISKRLEKYSEVDVWEAARVFAFDPASGSTYSNHVVKGSKFFFDGEILQLFDKRRPNTFIWLALNAGFSQRNGIIRKNEETKAEFKASIALQKLGGPLVKSHARVNKQACQGMEMYVISNRDRVGHDILDNLINYKETTEIMRNIQNTPKEYNLRMEAADWVYREFCWKIIGQKNMGEISKLNDICEFEILFASCVDLFEYDVLFEIVKVILKDYEKYFFNIIKLPSVLVNLVSSVPTIAGLVVQTLYDIKMMTVLEERRNFSIPQTPELYLQLASALIISTTEQRELSVKKFEQLLELMSDGEVGLKFSFNQMKRMVKCIVFTVRHYELALNYLELIFNEESPPIFTTTSQFTSLIKCAESELMDFKYYSHFMRALSVDYLNEVHEACPCDFWGLPRGSEDQQDDLKVSSSTKSRLETPSKLSDFFSPHNGLFKVNVTNNEEGFKGNKEKSPAPQPHQKCLEIRHCEQPNNNNNDSDSKIIYETTLRIDIPCSIRNEDHLRFCASRRSSDKPGQRSSVFDAIVVSLTKGTLQFYILQPAPAELTTASWNLYICASTTNLTTQITAIEKIINHKKKATTAYMDILGYPISESRVVSTVPKIVSVSFIGSTFNDSQKQAVETALNNPLTLIWGPPGSGKTVGVVQIIINFQRAYPDSRILVSASTHNAVDNVMERFLKEREKLDIHKGSDDSDNFIRFTSDVSKVSPSLKKWTLDAFAGGDIHSDYKAKNHANKKLKLANIVFSTCSGAGVGLLRNSGEVNENGNDDSKKTKNKKSAAGLSFDIVIVDEASQITEPNALIPIVKASQFVILVGDHVQLQPTVSEIAKDHDLQVSLFQKLYESTSVSAKKVMLNVQYRMHPDIAKYASDQFYDSKLLNGVSNLDRPLFQSAFPWPQNKGNDLDKFRFVFVHCSCPEVFGASKSNIGQVMVAVKLIELLRKNNINGQLNPKIAILTPYTKQVTRLKEKLKGTVGVEVGTIDGFQGREADIIIFSTVRSNRHNQLGFLDDCRRVNVAITRAKYGIIVIGDSSTLEENKLWKTLLQYSVKLDEGALKL